MSFCEAPIHPYQQVGTQWMIDHPKQKGLLTVLGTGYGKTRAAADSIMGMLASGIVDKCFVITPAKLQENFKEGLSECGAKHLPIEVLSNEMFIKHFESLKIDNRTLLTIDESHNLRNPNTSRYRAMKKACSLAGKILLFTATPMKTTDFDIIPQIGLFLDMRNIKNDQELFNRIRDHVAYFSLDGTQYDTKPRVKFFSVLVPMTDLQESRIVEVMEENKITTIGELKSVLNAAEDEEDETSEKTQTQKALNMFFNKVRRFANSEAAKVCSPKMNEMVKIIKQYKGQAMIYSFWIAMGVDLAESCLHKAYPDMKIGLLTGSTSQRSLKSTLSDYNSKHIQTLIFSSSASEGVSTKGTDVMIITEPQWQYVAEQQAIARGVRINSHLNRKNPEVHVYYLLSHSDKFAIANIDELMFQKNREKYQAILHRMELLRQASIPVSEDAIVYHNYIPTPMEYKEDFTKLLHGVKGKPGSPGKKQSIKPKPKVKKSSKPKIKKSKVKKSSKPKISKPKVKKVSKPKVKKVSKPKVKKVSKPKIKKVSKPKVKKVSKPKISKPKVKKVSKPKVKKVSKPKVKKVSKPKVKKVSKPKVKKSKVKKV